MRAICDLQEALDSITEMSYHEIVVNSNFIRDAVNEARVYLGYYRTQKQTLRKQEQTVHRLRTRIKELTVQMETVRHQLMTTNEQLEQALKDLRQAQNCCDFCKHDLPNNGCASNPAWDSSCFEWRGVERGEEDAN